MVVVCCAAAQCGVHVAVGKGALRDEGRQEVETLRMGRHGEEQGEKEE